jgi:hypothetical protein
MARPPTYQSDAERPMTVSVRMPQALYAQAKHHASLRRTTLTELLLDGLRLRLDTPADPRDILVSQDNTVIQQLQEMVDTAVQHALANERDMLRPAAALAVPHEPADPPPPAAGVKQCGKGHTPYPASKLECPHCVRLRKQKQREHQAHGKRGELPALS